LTQTIDDTQPQPLTAHDKLLELSRFIGLPEAFFRDLYLHDRRTLERERWTHFIWMVRATGTELIPMNGEYLAGQYPKRVSPSWLQFRQIHRYFWYNENLLREITPEEALKVIGTPEDRILLWRVVKNRKILLEMNDVHREGAHAG